MILIRSSLRCLITDLVTVFFFLCVIGRVCSFDHVNPCPLGPRCRDPSPGSSTICTQAIMQDHQILFRAKTRGEETIVPLNFKREFHVQFAYDLCENFVTWPLAVTTHTLSI